MADLGESILTLTTDASGLDSGIARGKKGAQDLSGEFEKQAAKIAGQFQTIGLGLTAFGATVTAGFGLATKSAADLQLGIVNITNLLGKDGSQFSKPFTDGVKAISAEFGQSKDGLTKGLFDIVSAGTDAGDALEVLAASAKLANAGVTDTGVTTSALLTTLKSYSDQVRDAADASDVLFSIQKFGRTTLAEVASGFGAVAPLASLAGVSLNNLGAALATATLGGSSTAEVITGLQALFNSFIQPTDDAVAAAKELGFEMNASALQGDNFTKTLKAIAGGSIEQQAAIAGSTRAFRALGPIVQDTGKFQEIYNGIADRTGVVTEAAANVAETSKAKWARLTETLDNLRSDVGDLLLPALDKIVGTIQPIIEATSAWIKANPELAATIATAAASLGVMATVVGTSLIGIAQLIKVQAAMALGWTTVATTSTGFLGAVKNVQFAVSNNLVGALSGGEKAMLLFGKASVLAAGAIVGWQIGKLIADTEAFKKATEGLVKALQPLTDQLAGVNKANASLGSASEQLAAKLKEQGIVIERGQKPLKEWNAQLLAAASGLVKNVTPALAGASAGTKDITTALSAFGIKTKEIREKELADLKKKLDDVKVAYREGKVTLTDLNTAQNQYNTAAGITKEALDKIKEAAEKAKLEFRDLVFPLIDATEGLTKMDAAGRLVFSTWEEIGKSIEAAKPSLAAVIEGMDSLEIATTAAGSAVDLADTSVIELAGGLRDLKVPLDANSQAMKTLGIETDDLRNKKLRDLKAALDDVADGFGAGTRSADELKRAQEAYAKAVGSEKGATKQTTLWGKSLEQVSTVLTDLGKDLAGRFSAAVKTGIGPIDDFTNAIIRLVSEQVMGAMIKGLASLISHIPGLSKLSGLLTNIGGSAASTAGSVGGVGGGVGGAGGAGGAAGAGAGGALGIATLITGAISAISGIIGNFQTAKTNDRLFDIGGHLAQIKINTADLMAADGPQWQSVNLLSQIADRLWDRGPLVEIRELLRGGISVGGTVPQAIVEAGDRNVEATMETGRTFSESMDRGARYVRDGFEETGRQIIEGADRGFRHVREGIDGMGRELGSVVERSSRFSERTTVPIPEIPEHLKRLPGSAGSLAQGTFDSQFTTSRQFGSRGETTVLPRFASGIDFLPRDTFAMLHQGEAVLTKQENAARTQAKQPVIFKFMMDGRELARATADNLNDLVSRQSLRLVASEVR